MRLNKKPVIRDFLITKSGYIFAVCDYFHPKSEVRAILRYVPDENGNRVMRLRYDDDSNSNTGYDTVFDADLNVSKFNGKKYRKLGFDESYEFMRKHHPDWVKDVILVPDDEILKVLKPNDAILKSIKSGKNSTLNKIIDFFYERGIPYEYMGVSGSILPGLESEGSDIDFVVYEKYWPVAQKAIESISKKQTNFSSNCDCDIKPLDLDLWKKVYEKRNSPLSFDTFLKHEKRKYNRGCVDGIYFDVLFVRDEKNAVPILRGRDKKRVAIDAFVTDDSYSYDSPALYKIDHEIYSEVLSYTHSYAGQALKNEVIEVSGIEEDLGFTKRIVVGTKREPKDEWIISKTLIENEE
ncbi:MAG: DNA polymerase subunit beta [Methanosarcinaceae archaeon]|nr:DNA polymerase subunit beta [Methanosarcinaceae archaeon]